VSKPNALSTSYVHLPDDRSAELVDGTPQFWSELASGRRPELEAGRLITQFDCSADWESWEIHPLGDELVLLLSGRVELLLERTAGVDSVKLAKPGQFVVIPRDTWHTARVTEKSSLIFVTPGKGTRHRAV
jgi:mannose-6-phosphate isomerase-like protein (cupin superfamily)